MHSSAARSYPLQAGRRERRRPLNQSISEQDLQGAQRVTRVSLRILLADGFDIDKPQSRSLCMTSSCTSSWMPTSATVRTGTSRGHLMGKVPLRLVDPGVVASPVYASRPMTARRKQAHT